MTHYYIDLISSGLTIITILLAMVVVYHWRDSVCEAVTAKNTLTAEQWLVVGVTVSFLAQSLDNGYWLIAWSSNLISPEGEAKAWLFKNGTMFNLFFRQLPGIFAAYCHIRALQEYSKAKLKISYVLILSSILGLFYSLVLALFS